MKILRIFMLTSIITSSVWAMKTSEYQKPIPTFRKVKDKWIRIYPSPCDEIWQEKAQEVLASVCPDEVKPNAIHDEQYGRTFFDHYLGLPLPKSFYVTLLNNGADPLIKDTTQYKWPTFFSAVITCNIDALEALVEHNNGALVPQLQRATDSSGNTALHRLLLFAERVRNAYATAKFLLLHGFNVNASNNNQETPLHLACSLGSHYDLAKLFLKHGTNPDAQTYYGNTPFHECFGNRWSGSLEEKAAVAQLLVRYNADLNIKNRCNLTALEFAKHHPHIDIHKIVAYEDYNEDAGELLAKYENLKHTAAQ